MRTIDCFMAVGRSFVFAAEINVSSWELKSLNKPRIHLRFLYFIEAILSWENWFGCRDDHSLSCCYTLCRGHFRITPQRRHTKATIVVANKICKPNRREWDSAQQLTALSIPCLEPEIFRKNEHRLHAHHWLPPPIWPVSYVIPRLILFAYFCLHLDYMFHCSRKNMTKPPRDNLCCCLKLWWTGNFCGKFACIVFITLVSHCLQAC